MQKSLIDYLLTRRSVKAQNLAEPAPNDEQLRQMLTAAMRVPDHGKLAPWRIHVLRGEALARFSDVIASRYAAIHPEAEEKHSDYEKRKICQAPLLIVVTSEPIEGRIPLWEQTLSCGALCMNLLHAAHALGFAGNWISEWPTYDAEITHYFCGDALHGKIAGFFFIGTATQTPDERPRPDWEQVVKEY